MPEPVRVALVLADSAGGIARHVAALARGLPERGIAVTVLGPSRTLDKLGLDSTSSRAWEVPVGQLLSPAGWSARRALRLAAADHDLVHAHGLRATVHAATAGPPILVSTWHNAPLGGAARRVTHAGLERYAARHSAVTLAVSGDLADRARRAGAGDVRDMFVVAPPLPGAPPRVQARQSLGVGAEPLIVAVGRLHRQKRFDVLVDAAASWPAAATRPLVVIAGEGPLRPQLARQIALTGAPVRLLGARPDVAALLAAADAVAISSDWEARALIAQEALRAGVPLVATSVGGLPELVGEAAVLVAPGDPAGLGTALRRVIEDDSLRSKLTTAATQASSGWPQLNDILDDLAGLYLSLTFR